jgi:hypothetical protein
MLHAIYTNNSRASIHRWEDAAAVPSLDEGADSLSLADEISQESDAELAERIELIKKQAEERRKRLAAFRR